MQKYSRIEEATYSPVYYLVTINTDSKFKGKTVCKQAVEIRKSKINTKELW